MSETTPKYEAPITPAESPEMAQKMPERSESEPTVKAEVDPGQSIENIRASIEKEATEQTEINHRLPAGESTKAEPALPPNKELKDISLKRSLKHIQKQLPIQDRLLSKVIHQPIIERTSDFAAKTVARPSAVLTGGVVALIGSSLYLFFAKHYGLGYNYLLVAVLFVGGFFVGLIIELFVHLFRRKRA